MDFLQNCLFLMLLCVLFPTVIIRAENDQTGFITLDCGSPEGTNYTDEHTGIRYVSDESFIDSGQSYSISPTSKTAFVPGNLQYLRSFPNGNRNCYILKLAQNKSLSYLIRATFFHGDYDGTEKYPNFDIHIDVNYWDTVNITGEDIFIDKTMKEIIHIPTLDVIHVCLVDTGRGTPFISILELRPIADTPWSSYEEGGSELVLVKRLNFGGINPIRYKDDVYDRIWEAYNDPDSALESIISPTDFPYRRILGLGIPPDIVMSTAARPTKHGDTIRFTWEASSLDDDLQLAICITELEKLKVNESREVKIYHNGKNLGTLITNKYLDEQMVIYYLDLEKRSLKHELVMNRTKNSTRPPIINALEIFKLRKLPLLPTDQKDSAAMMAIKSMYKVTRNWQGDPCEPKTYAWRGLNCSYDKFNLHRIISMNLSASELTGLISPSISNLTMLQTLDLSNNDLNGPVPEFLAELKSLKFLNLKGNNFSGLVPAKLLEKSHQGLLSLSMDDPNTNTEVDPKANGDTDPNTVKNADAACKNFSCKKKNKIIISVVASLFALVALFATLTILCMVKRRRKKAVSSNKVDNEILESNNKRFTYSEIIKITNNFQNIIGQGGFGTVYHGTFDKIEVAVKMLSSTSGQGYKEFRSEANVLINVHHKNLTSMIGYCIEGTNMGIIYEYIANGDLKGHLADKNLNVLSWSERLQIAIDAAQGLDYLHHGCKQSIIHRDVKCTNILLDEKFQAKLSDFGLSRAFPVGGGSYLTTDVAGTPGYLDPEYYMSNKLTKKSDVFSFGVVLLEIFTGRPAIQNHEHDPVHVKHWVSSILKDGDVKEIVDPRLMGDFDVNSAWKAIEIAMACVANDSTNRPTMSHVVIEINEALAIEMTKGESKIIDSTGYISSNSFSSPSVR